MPPDEPVHIWVRHDVDYDDEAVFRAQLPENMEQKVELWDQTFTIPYHRFRGRLRQIAAENHARVAGAVVSALEAIPDGAWVLPVDDDDWYPPQAARVVTARGTPELEGLVWRTSYLEVPIHFGHRTFMVRRALRMPFTPPRSLCSTNSYAVRMGPDTRTLLDTHIRASRWFAGEGEARVTHIPGRHNVINRTLASQTMLRFDWPEIKPRELLVKYRCYRRLYRLPWKRRGWARPHVEEMARLMDEMEVR
jgi:hypothetical protein